MVKWIQYSDGVRAERPGFECTQRRQTPLLFTTSRLAMELTQPCIHWILEDFSTRGKADHSPETTNEAESGETNVHSHCVIMA
jgi:hypothetical protein